MTERLFMAYCIDCEGVMDMTAGELGIDGDRAVREGIRTFRISKTPHTGCGVEKKTPVKDLGRRLKTVKREGLRDVARQSVDEFLAKKRRDAAEEES